MIAGADGAAIDEVERRLIGDGVEDEAGDIGEFVEAGVETAQAGGLLGVEAAFESGDFFEGAAEGKEIARAGGAEGDFGEQAFEIENGGELLAQFGAQDGLLAELADGVEALLDFGAVHGGAEEALAEETAAHAGEGLIEHAEDGELGLGDAGVGGEDGLEQFEIADGDGVEDHGVGAVVVSGAVEVVEGGALGVAEVVEDGAGGADGGGAIGEAAAIEGEQLEVIAEGAVGVIVGEDPVFEFGADEARAGAFVAGEEGQVGGEEDFAGAEVFEGAGHFGGVHVGDFELAGGDVDVGDGGAGSVVADGGEEVVLAGTHEGGVHGGAGGDDAHDLALDEALGGFGIFHLVADGDAESFLDETGDVAFGGVEGDSAHGDGGSLFFVA